MFAARAIAVSVSVFVIVYCAMSFAVCLAWRRVWLYAGRRSSGSSAGWLFRLRVFPALAAVAVTLAFALPSFLLLEPRGINEPLGRIPLLLSMLGIALGAFGFASATLALRRSSRAISAWKRGAVRVETTAPVPVLQVTSSAPAMTAAGIVRPAILLSATAQALLSTNELRTALNHELAHLRQHDNLKKLLLRCVAFPGMAGLEAAWVKATEMGADDAAVSNSREALDLAAALIKLSRVRAQFPPAQLTATLVQIPVSLVNTRVERLLAWKEPHDRRARGRSAWYGYSAAIAAFALVAVSYSQLLVGVHSVTEWLMR